jgi:exopolysaccharide biosynthesis predicted pyruvyltransferase EpsI
MKSKFKKYSNFIKKFKNKFGLTKKIDKCSQKVSENKIFDESIYDCISSKKKNNQFSKHFIELKKELSSIEGEIIFMANGGNWGDGLIREGTLKLFKDISLKYKEIPHSFDPELPRDSTFIFGGGGAWCKNWRQGPIIVNKARRKCQKVIVLPSTYSISNNYYEDVVYWARDSLTSLKINSFARSCPDMALYLDPIDNLHKGKGVGNKYRTDKESAQLIHLPEDNDDISLRGGHMTSSKEMLKDLISFEKIKTDRLHVAIAAGHILNIPTMLIKSDYSKIPDIYNTWLKDVPTITLIK